MDTSREMHEDEGASHISSFVMQKFEPESTLKIFPSTLVNQTKQAAMVPLPVSQFFWQMEQNILEVYAGANHLAISYIHLGDTQKSWYTKQ